MFAIRSLRTQILLLVTLGVTACLAIVALFAGYALGRATETQAADHVLALAETLAVQPGVAAAMESADPSAVLQPLAEQVRGKTRVEFVVFLSPQAIRWSHPTPRLIGKRFTGGDEGPALAGAHYVSRATGISGPSLRAFAPVYNQLGRQVGVVVVGVWAQTLNSSVQAIRAPLWGAALLSLLLAGTAAWALARRVKRTLLGLEPAEIATLLQQRETILASVREGVLAVDAGGRITLVNAEACRLLGCGTDVVGQLVMEVIPNSHLAHVAITGKPEFDQQQALPGSRTILANRVPILVNGQVVGAVATFRDKSEVQQLAEQLTGVQRFVAGLRAQAHEFANRLQAIKGLIQLGAYEEVLQFVNATAHADQDKIQRISKCVGDPAVAGLLLGKMAEAREHGVQLLLSPDSYLPAHTADPGLLVTVLGNLLDNALEAGANRILVTCAVTNGSVTITVQDDGPGIPDYLHPHLFRPGTTTRGEGRGYGLANVEEALSTVGGTIALDPTSSQGATFHVRLPLPSSNC